MTESHLIEGVAAPLPIANLDTDQIMPKQFLRGVDKRGLDQGLLYDLRYDGEGKTRTDFVLNRPEFVDTRVILGGANFGCGSSREHAVWGLLQFGIQAVIASSYGEIFYSNAMNNRLMLVTLDEPEMQALMAAANGDEPLQVAIDVETMKVRAGHLLFDFSLSERHRQMFLNGWDMVGASISHSSQIDAFAQNHWRQQPWLKDVARITRDRLDCNAGGGFASNIAD